LRKEGQIQVEAKITVIGWYDKALETFEPSDVLSIDSAIEPRLGEALKGETRDGFARAIRRLLGLPTVPKC